MELIEIINILQQEYPNKVIVDLSEYESEEHQTYKYLFEQLSQKYAEKLNEVGMLATDQQNYEKEIAELSQKNASLAELSCVNYSQLTKVFNNKAHIGLSSVIKIAAALRVSPSELFPYDQNKRKTNGQRFDEITKGMDLASINYLLDVCAGYSKLNRNNRKL